MRKVLEIISNTIYAIILLIVAVLIIAVLMGIRPYKVLSGSMEPTIKTGSLCFVDTNYEYDDVKRGDIIAFTILNNTMVTHRVVNITADGMETKGDNNANSDGISTTEENFSGKTVLYIPYVGYALSYMQHPIALFGIAIFVVIFILATVLCKED